MSVKYPTGVRPITTQPAMKNYNVKPINHHFPWSGRKKRHSKYNANKVTIDHITFDSKAESRYYILCKAKHANFAYHHRYLLHPHTEYKYHGLTIKLQKRSYCPDFIRWKQGQKRSWRHPDMVIDIKGKRQVTVGANRQMDDFSRIYHIPVIIARFDYRESRKLGMFVFKEHVRGTKKKLTEVCPIGKKFLL